MRIRRAIAVACPPTRFRRFPSNNPMRITASSTCPKGTAFISISVTTKSARRTCSQRDHLSSEETPNAIETLRTWPTNSNVTRSIPIPAVQPLPFMEATVYHHSTLAIPKSIIPSRPWLLVPLSASALRLEVCASDAVKDLEVNVVLWSLEASGSLPLPAVLTAPIRLDVVQQVHSTHMLDQGFRDGFDDTLQRASPKIGDSHTLSAKKPATKPPQNLGVLAVL